ncbi:Putative acetyltransferases and hydrolases with the alpha/beta hydrolase fold [Gloeomargarita lithophora Alchichica-D10]|uniref:Acetyltransferases and hydrolases with the alpha/beta hydrolase fold n=1 Tax=Gloeomargarita lithophora Alchichica-D10 TaxID=1188229 RepID=A0A1J0AA90_9CYAN|nr:alpha/beta fold hydrolase [Gloeomargarita lithophora]APB32864.1 Putative acetyltransferases and hydrolases with the alpha/beta hydrolase fold [Gloeomargarita lithophora Alchichica-D10]
MPPVVLLPGYLAGQAPYRGLVTAAQSLGVAIQVVPLRWWDWLPTLGGRSVAPILEPLDHTIQQVQQQYPGEKITLIGHSAGGWISRIYLGQTPYYGRVWGGAARVARLVTLGTPHTSQERWTRKNLDFVNTEYPGAYHPEIQYICIAGQAVQGRKWTLAYESYRLTCGQGDAWGDGITPVAAAHLAGAENLTLPSVWHSPSSPGEWYGSPGVLPQWLPRCHASSDTKC